VKDPNWSHPGKSTSYPRRSIPVTTTSTDPKPDPSFANCCSEVTVVNEMSASAPTRPDELYKKGQASAASSAPASAGGKPLRVGGPGDGLIAFGATMYRCALPA